MTRGRKDADPAAVREFRERRGWTHEQMADAVHASPMEVAAWEAGTVRMPPDQARRIRSLDVQDRRMAAVVEAGLPRCAWAEANAPGLHEMLCMRPARLDSSLRAQRHLGECETCRCVHAFGRALRMPAPDSRLGSEHVGLLRPALELVAAVALGWALLRSGWDLRPDWVEPIVVGVGMFWLTACVLGSFLARTPRLSWLVLAVMVALGVLLAWSMNQVVTPLTLVAAGAILLVAISRATGGHSRTGKGGPDDGASVEDGQGGGPADADPSRLAEPASADRIGGVNAIREAVEAGRYGH